MKTYISTNPSKVIFKKRVLLVISLIFTGIMLFLAPGCQKEDQQPRFVFPVVTTAPVTSITATGATSGGDITSDGGSGITARGICCRTTSNPSIAYPDSTSVNGNGPGQFVSNISGLVAGKTYHIRAYATNSSGTSYGEDVTFQTTAK
jgi:hypothetical protein